MGAENYSNEQNHFSFDIHERNCKLVNPYPLTSPIVTKEKMREEEKSFNPSIN